MSINERVKYYRGLKGYSQKEFSEMLDIKKTTYSYVEKEGNISCELAKKMAEILEIDIRLLLYGEDEIGERNNVENILSEIDKSKFFVVLNNCKEAKLLELFQGCSENKKNVILECVNSICNSDSIK